MVPETFVIIWIRFVVSASRTLTILGMFTQKWAPLNLMVFIPKEARDGELAAFHKANVPI